MEVKLYEKIAVIFLIAFLGWILISWADVMMHNDPIDGDQKYHDWNIFTIAFDKE